MQVETFECQETSAEPIEATEEAVALMEQLGLEGQRELMCPKKHERDVRSPYREITRDERFAYQVICPQTTPLAKYKSGPIPLRVLQIAAHAQSLGMFDELVVWHRTESVVPDPVLIGVKKKPGSSWEKTEFILARWGDELETLSVLVKRAVAIKKEQYIQSAVEAAEKLRVVAATISNAADETIVKFGADVSVYLSLPYGM